MTAPVNLQELVFDRRELAAPRPRRTFVTRYLLPACMLVGFAVAVFWAFRDSLSKRVPVTVVPVVSLRAEFQEANTPLFRSAGWVEPRPTPVIVSALTEGIVERLLVVEGQQVNAGEPIAELLRADAEIAVRQARAELDLQRSELESAQATLLAAEAYFREPIERLALVAEAESELAAIQTEQNRLPSLLQAAEARVAQSHNELESKSKSRDAVAGILLSRAESELDIAKANLQELQAQQLSIVLQREALLKRRDVLQRQLELKVEEQRQLSQAQAQLKSRQADVELANAKLAEMELRLSRTVVTAPTSGIVLSLVARPGSKLMGFAPGSLQDASTVVTMYDPNMLQIRADVRLENVPQVSFDQVVEIVTPAVSGTLRGKVLAVTSMTDIQKNTLQVKVAVENPPPVLKPDMLVEAVFLAPPRPVATTSSPPLRLMIPQDLIDSSGPQPMVWLADRRTNTARRRIVTPGTAVVGNLIEVAAGVTVGDRLIVSGRELLSEDCRIEIRQTQVQEFGGVSKAERSTDFTTNSPQRLP